MSSPPRPGASPLAPVLAFTGLSSFAAGSATLGIFFVTERAYGFSPAQQYALGLLVGLTYALGALAASALRRALARTGLSARATLALFSAALALLVLVPLVATSAAALFVVLGLYAPITGFFWPLVEQYVSGGRRGGELRSAVGRFNIVWSATLLPSFWILSPLLERSPALVFASIVLAHGIALASLTRFPREPGEHEEEAAHAVPPSYAELLRVHRVLHASAYLVMYALAPMLPALLAGAGVAPALQSVVASTWLLARLAGFVWLERWHGWHGRWSAASGGMAAVLVGLALVVLAPRLAPALLPGLLLGLVLFGLGLSALYTAALYYVFEIGGSEGGGSHEALIGLGYSLGPLCGLLVCGLERAGAVASARREGALLAVVAGLSLGAAAWAWRQRRPRTP